MICVAWCTFNLMHIIRLERKKHDRFFFGFVCVIFTEHLQTARLTLMFIYFTQRIDPLTQAQEPDNDVTSVEMEITRNDTPTDDHASIHSPPSTPSPKQEGYEIDQLRQMAEEHHRRHRGHRPVEQEVVMKAQQKKNEKREREEWFKGFVHLAKGLYSTDTSKTGKDWGDNSEIGMYFHFLKYVICYQVTEVYDSFSLSYSSS